MKGYVLYISTQCAGCEKVLSEINEMGVDVPVVNIDLSDQRPAFPLVVVPALIHEDKLLAYGSDIIEQLSNRFT